MNSNIYIIGGSQKPYKIGFSKNPQQRLKTLQTGFPEKLQLHYIKEINEEQVRHIEKVIHKTINYKRTKGEWFNIDLEDAISEINFAVIKHDSNR